MNVSKTTISNWSHEDGNSCLFVLLIVEVLPMKLMRTKINEPTVSSLLFCFCFLEQSCPKSAPAFDVVCSLQSLTSLKSRVLAVLGRQYERAYRVCLRTELGLLWFVSTIFFFFWSHKRRLSQTEIKLGFSKSVDSLTSWFNIDPHLHISFFSCVFWVTFWGVMSIFFFYTLPSCFH